MVVACGEIMLQPVVPRTTAVPMAIDAMRRGFTDPPRTDDGFLSILGVPAVTVRRAGAQWGSAPKPRHADARPGGWRTLA